MAADMLTVDSGAAVLSYGMTFTCSWLISIAGANSYYQNNPPASYTLSMDFSVPIPPSPPPQFPPPPIQPPPPVIPSPPPVGPAAWP